MADNPLDDSNPEHRQRIRERAYQLWEADGCPEGHELEYWDRAAVLVGMTDNPQAGLQPNPIAADIDPNAPTVEEAAIQDNLGEFPDRLADQGEHQPTPIVEQPPPAEVPPPKARRPAGKAAAKGRSRPKSGGPSSPTASR